MIQSIMLNLKAQHLVLQANPLEQSHRCCSESCQTTVHRLALETPDPVPGAEQWMILAIGLSGNLVPGMCL